MLNFLLETFRLGLKNLRLHKLRSLLTAMGIIIGVAAVIIMVAIGEGAKRDALEQLQQLGAKNILVRSRPPPESTESAGRASSMQEFGIRRTDLERLRTLPDVETIVPLRDTEQKVVHRDVRVMANPIGTTPEVFDVMNLRLARGAYFDALQYDRGESVCVVGHRAAQQLFPYEDPLGQQVRVGTGGMGTVMLTIIGVLEPTGLRAGSEGAAMMGRDPDMGIYFPLTLAEDAFGDLNIKRLAQGREVKRIELSDVWLKAKSTDDVEKLAEAIENVVGLQQKGGPQDLKNTPRLDIDVKAPLEILRAAERTQRTFNTVMVGVAGFALLVGGIGIMNIMLATVTERTKEVGIRRALGAKRKHITLQFLIETTVITLAGGLIGVCLGAAGAKLLPVLVEFFFNEQKPTAIATWSVVGSFVISGLIGVGFGLYPAMKAAWMNPIEALRHE
ncbi:MAG: ABC-type antimicrobial peptide transport system, permease component [Phycisphaerales bacterium]|nr:ABC-type antimicrobial peptide transport system, permease component [Phycisphaerales bacterium]